MLTQVQSHDWYLTIYDVWKLDNLYISFRLNEVIKLCKDANVKSIENKEKYLPEKKFSKLLPSLDAVSDICQRIHAEGLYCA